MRGEDLLRAMGYVDERFVRLAGERRTDQTQEGKALSAGSRLRRRILSVSCTAVVILLIVGAVLIGAELLTDGTWLFVDYVAEDSVFAGTEERRIQYYDRESRKYLGELNLGTQAAGSLLVGDDKYLFWFRRTSDSKEQILYAEKCELEDKTAEVHVLCEAAPYDDTWRSWE